MLRAIVSLAASVGLAAPVFADERRLEAGEIDTLLKGNTVFGQIGEGRFRHFFSRNGKTSFNPPDSSERIGTWRVDTANNRLEIRWRTGEAWIPVTVYIDGKTVTLDYVDGPRHAGTVMDTRGIE